MTGWHSCNSLNENRIEENLCEIVIEVETRDCKNIRLKNDSHLE